MKSPVNEEIENLSIGYSRLREVTLFISFFRQTTCKKKGDIINQNQTQTNLISQRISSMEEQAEQRHSMEIHEYALYIIGRRKQGSFEGVTRWEDGRRKKKRRNADLGKKE